MVVNCIHRTPTYQDIHDANIQLHKIEADYYNSLHSEIFNNREQNRIVQTLKKIDQKIEKNTYMALDFGAGTGNLTEKLLIMGYQVTAIDISKKMCDLLEKKYHKETLSGQLKIINKPIEELLFNAYQFDLIVCYSVLHHLPDYIGTIKHLIRLLKIGGIMYLDHEPSLRYWKEYNKHNFIKKIYSISNSWINRMVEDDHTGNIPQMNYQIADYWINLEHHVDHNSIESIFIENQFTSINKQDYYLYRCRRYNPFFPIYKIFCSPDTSFWIGQK